jgi:uncharacterized membrane protein
MLKSNENKNLEFYMEKISWQKQLTRFRSQFLTGLVVILPLTLTLIIILFLFNKLDSILGNLLHKYMAQHYIRGLGLIILLVSIWLVGLFATNFLGRQFVNFYESIIGRIPFLNSLFKGLKDLSHNLFSEGSTSFKSVVLTYNPVYGYYIMGFLTAAEPVKMRYKGRKEDVLHVLIPVPPNPASGFIVLVPKKNVIILDMSIEDGLKAVVSLGVIHPSEYIEKKIK